MKYLTCILFICVVAASHAQQVEANRSPVPRALIKISPLQFFSQTLELSVEMLNHDYSRALQISGSLRSGQSDYIDGHGAGGTLAYRKYVRPLTTPTQRNPEAVQGIYYSVFLKADYFTGEEQYWGQSQFDKTEEEIASVSPGFSIGLQRTIFEVLFLDVYIGGGIKFAAVNYVGFTPSEQLDYDVFHPGYDGIYPVVGIKIGVGL
jgi:hypothetical protein